MDDLRIDDEFVIHPRDIKQFVERLGIVFERIQACGHDETGRDCRRHIVIQNIHVRFANLFKVPKVGLEIVLVIGFGKPIPRTAQQSHRTRVTQAVCSVEEQHAARVHSFAVITQVEQRTECHICTRTVPREGDILRINSPLLSVLDDVVGDV